MGGRLHAADPDRGRPALAADRAQDPLRRPERLLRDPRLRRPGEGAPLPRAARRLHRRHRRRLLRQLQQQADRLRVRPHRRGQQDRPHPRQRRDRVGHDVGPRLGRQGRPRRAGLDGRVPRAPQPAALRPAGGAGLGPPRLALDRPQPGRGPVAAHPAPEHRAHVPARRAARHPRPAPPAPRRAAALRAGAGEHGPVRPRAEAPTAPARSASTPRWASPPTSPSTPP